MAPLLEHVQALQKHDQGLGGRVAPGTVVAGKYAIEREVASGGVGAVFLARHVELGHEVAIKCLHERFLGDHAVVERFKREARLAATIRSEHVVRVHDVGTLESGAPYMVMEYLEGEDLGAIVARGPVPVASAVDWLLQACEALAEAHRSGIVHRDLKPENLFLARKAGGGSIVKVLDFGISKIAPAAALASPFLPRVTQAGERFGTPLYMSPEQLVCSGGADARSDIWALGVVLYELLTGELPFPGEDVKTIFANVIESKPVPLLVKRPDAGPILDGIVAACLSRDPALRPADVGELTALLGAAVLDASVTRRAVETAPEALVTPPLAWTPTSAWGPRREDAASVPTLTGDDFAVPTTTQMRLVAPPPETAPRRGRAMMISTFALLATLAVVVLFVSQWTSTDPPVSATGIAREAVPPPAAISVELGPEPATSASAAAPAQQLGGDVGKGATNETDGVTAPVAPARTVPPRRRAAPTAPATPRTASPPSAAEATANSMDLRPHR